MKWQLAETGWPVGSYLVPVGSVIEAVDHDGGITPQWNGIPLRTPLPINAVPLDEVAAQRTIGWYPDWRTRLRFAPGLKIKWPGGKVEFTGGITEEQYQERLRQEELQRKKAKA